MRLLNAYPKPLLTHKSFKMNFLDKFEKTIENLDSTTATLLIVTIAILCCFA